MSGFLALRSSQHRPPGGVLGVSRRRGGARRPQARSDLQGLAAPVAPDRRPVAFDRMGTAFGGPVVAELRRFEDDLFFGQPDLDADAMIRFEIARKPAGLFGRGGRNPIYGVEGEERGV